jgi:hypothetical protein
MTLTLEASLTIAQGLITQDLTVLVQHRLQVCGELRIPGWQPGMNLIGQLVSL